MAKKISNESFVEKDFGQPVIDALKEILQLNKELANQLKETGKEASKSLQGLNPSESVKDAQKLTKELEKLTKAKEELNKVEANDIKITKELQKAEAEKLKQDKAALDLAIKENKVKQEQQKTLLAERKVVQQNQKIRVANRKERERQFKEREKERKQRKKQLTEYQKESRRLNELRNAYKELAVAEKENTKEAKALLREITALDKKLKQIDETVGQNQRSVGDYKKALEGLKDQAKALPLLAVAGGVALLGQAFGDTREGALRIQILLSKLTETAKVLIQNIIEASKGLPLIFEGIKDGFKALGDDISTVFINSELAYQKLQRTLQKGLAFAGVDGAEEEVKRLDDVILNLEKNLKDIENREPSTKLQEGIDKVKKAFENTADTTSRAITEQEKFLELQLETTIEIAKQEKALAGLAEQRQILQDISDDDTLSAIERAKFALKAREAAIELANKEEELALTREKLTIQAVKQDLRRANALSESRLQQIKTGEQLQKILEDEAIARKVSDANDEAFTAAFVERKNKQVEAETIARDQGEKQRKSARDDFEQQLDILEEFTEKRVAANEQIIASDSATLEERRKALEDNERLEKQLFNATRDRIIAQGKASLDLRKEEIETSKTLSDIQKAEKLAELEKRKELLTTQAIEQILNTQDEKEILNLIKKLQLGEIEVNRLKDSIKIKQDIAKINKEGAKAEDEATRKTFELQQDIALQEKKLKNETFDLQKAEFENQKKDLENRINLLKKDSIKRLELEKELNALKLEEQEKTNEEEEKNAKDSAEKRAEAVQKAAELVTNIVEKQNEKRLQAIDDTLNAVEERQSSLRAAAEQGNEQAVKSLAESEKQEAEIRQQKERELQRQQRIEAGLAAFQVFAANSQEDPKTALTKTITDITTLSALISSLPSFFVGTEDTGKTSNALDQNGGRLSILHDNERVMTAEQNKAIGPMTNEELTRLAVESRRGTFKQFEQVKPNEMNSVLVQAQQESIKDDIQQLIKEVKKNRPIDPVPAFDKRTKVYSEIYKQGNNKVRNHKKVFTAKNRN